MGPEYKERWTISSGTLFLLLTYISSWQFFSLLVLSSSLIHLHVVSCPSGPPAGSRSLVSSTDGLLSALEGGAVLITRGYQGFCVWRWNVSFHLVDGRKTGGCCVMPLPGCSAFLSLTFGARGESCRRKGLQIWQEGVTLTGTRRFKAGRWKCSPARWRCRNSDTFGSETPSSRGRTAICNPLWECKRFWGRKELLVWRSKTQCCRNNCCDYAGLWLGHCN